MYLPAIIYRSSSVKIDYNTAVSTFFGGDAAVLGPTTNLIRVNVHQFSENLTNDVLKESVPWIFNEYLMRLQGKGYYPLLAGNEGFDDILFNMGMPRAPRIEEGKFKIWLDGTAKTAQEMVSEIVKETIPIRDYDTVQNKTVQVYFNSKFVESIASAYFKLTPTVLA